MKWQEISIVTTECMMEAVANIFYDVGAGGVVIEDPGVINRYLEEDVWDYNEIPPELLKAENVTVKGYLPADDTFPERIKKLEGKLKSLEQYFEDYYGEITISQIHEKDWANAWKTYFKPQKIGGKIVVIPSWEKYELKEGEVPVYIDPGMAFGTGTHPTTELCIRALEEHLPENSGVYDVGTGSGILAIVAAKLGAKSVLARDLDELAVKVARKNVERNNLSDIVRVESGDLLQGLTNKVQCIVANIVADVIMSLEGSAFNLLCSGGKFIAGGIIAERKNEVESKLKERGFKIIETLSESGWVTIVAQRT